MNTQKLKIITDGSIIAIANTKKYNETLANQTNWTWRQLNNFILETNKDNLIVFDTSWENEWTVEFLINIETDKAYFRKFGQSIEVTDQKLYLINWTDLTTSLQFKDTKLPDEINKDLKFDIENGFYKVVVKQLFNPEDYEYEAENKINFIVELFSQSENPNVKADSIIWTEDFPNDDTVFLSDERNEFDDLLDKMINESK
ncbi:hypothetical protein [Pedobacter namyangjuensis]|uniref:hypothetical protein n=1 Tax=Pedobacter namyangjuensis TaxID=600626 RepID=UPI000DE2AAB7|nr:hypothetical protein [Pedobacter namyangjuensis]